MKVLETEYKGILFRSILEARWAVLFDLLNIEYIYEPECFILSNDMKYTPDFYLPFYDYYIEIKPNFEWLRNKYHLKRYESFSKKLIVLSGGFPNFNVNKIYNIDGYNQDVCFVPIYGEKYDNIWASGYELGSDEDNWNDCYELELNKLKNYRFWN